MHPCLSLNSTSTILMVRPSNFGSNPQTLSDNAFQSSSAQQSALQIQAQAVKQFDCYVQELEGEGVTVIVVEDTKELVKPDAVFPNNWFTTDSKGRVVVFPMKPVSRRAEKKNPVLQVLKEKGYLIKEIIDLSQYEEKGIFLQGTGSIIFDHQNHLAYACKSQRTSQTLFQKLCTQIYSYTPVFFQASDKNGLPYYHTNVIMSVCSDFVIVCLEAITDLGQREEVRGRVLGSVGSGGGRKELVEISVEQVGNFCGNVLEVSNGKGEKILTMSQTAFKNFTEAQLQVFQNHCRILKVDIPCIQNYGGGGTRCMMAQIFLPKAK